LRPFSLSPALKIYLKTKNQGLSFKKELWCEAQDLGAEAEFLGTKSCHRNVQKYIGSICHSKQSIKEKKV
jgi:hypothetical protein